MKTDKVRSLLSLAAKAGRLKSGEFSSEKAIKEGMASLVLVAEDASENTKKHFSDLCAYRNIPYQVYGNSAEIGRAIGKGFRMTIAVCDSGFASSIMKQFAMEG